MKVLVTGATGFIGHLLAERLLEQGAVVRVLARSAERAASLRALGAEVALGDVASGCGISGGGTTAGGISAGGVAALGASGDAVSRKGLEGAVDGMEAVAHLAGAIRAWGRAAYFATNCEGTRRLADASRRRGVKTFVLASSMAAHGPVGPGGRLTEATEPRPVNAYGESKLAAEKALAAAAGDMSWTIVRPCAVYGPRDRDVLALFRMAARGVVFYTGPREARLSLIHAGDLVDLLVSCLERPRTGRAYLASDGLAHTWPEIIRAIFRALGRERGTLIRLPPWLLLPFAVAIEGLRPFTARPPIFCLDKLREARAHSWVASPELAAQELGWKPRISLDEGLRSTAAWYKEHGWL